MRDTDFTLRIKILKFVRRFFELDPFISCPLDARSQRKAINPRNLSNRRARSGDTRCTVGNERLVPILETFRKASKRRRGRGGGTPLDTTRIYHIVWLYAGAHEARRSARCFCPNVCRAAPGSRAIEVSSTVFLYTRTAFFAPRACTFPRAPSRGSRGRT